MSERDNDGGQGIRLSGFHYTLLLLTIIALLGVNLGMFLRVNQLQTRILAALEGGGARVGAPQDLPRGLEPGAEAPGFSLEAVDGPAVALEDFRGSRVLVMFSQVNCPACQTMYPAVRRFHEEYPEVPMVVVSRGSDEENRAVVEDEGLSMPVVRWEDAVARSYEVPGTPYFFVIDERGVIAESDFASSFDGLERLACPDGCGAAAS